MYDYHKLPNGKYVTIKDEVMRKNIMPNFYYDKENHRPVFTDEYSYQVLYNSKETSAYDSKGMLLWEKYGDRITTETILNAGNIRTGIREYNYQTEQMEDSGYTFDAKGRVTGYTYSDQYRDEALTYTWGDDDMITSFTDIYRYADYDEEFARSYSYQNITTVLNREYFDVYSLQPLGGGSDEKDQADGMNTRPLPFTDIQKYVWDDYTLRQWLFDADVTIIGNQQATIRILVDDAKGEITQRYSVGDVETRKVVSKELANGGNATYEIEGNDTTEFRVKEYNQYGALTKEAVKYEEGYQSQYTYNREYDAQGRPTKTTYTGGYGFQFEETYDAWVAIDLENATSIPAVSADATATIQAYPNPVVNTLYIKVENNAHIKAQLYNLQGQLLLQTNESTIDFATYPAGIYILDVNGERVKVIK